MAEVVAHLDELIDVSNGRNVVWNERLQGCLKLQHFRLVLEDVLKQVLHVLADWQVIVLSRIIAICSDA